MSDPHKVTIKIGDAEFSAEGDKDTVAAQFAAFLAAVANQPAPVPAPKIPDQMTPPGDDGGNGNGGDGAGGDHSPDLVKRAFKVSKDIVSLNYLPKTAQKDSDALLLLLYGYTVMKGQEQVLGTQLIRAARQSGVTLERVDRALARHEPLLLKGGARKGLKYGLNNQGMKAAKEMLSALLDA
jgi:hypothetical protein